MTIVEVQCRPPDTRATTLRIGAVAAEIPALLAQPGMFLLADAAAMAHHAWAVASCPRLVLAGGEACKTWEQLGAVLRALARAELDRSATLVVFGGGALGDLGGLAASLFLRGIDVVQVPTTLLAMLDSSVGGKTAIDLPEGKNLVGTLWPASRVLIDPRFAATLSETELRSGLGEALKMAIGLEPALFALLADRREAVLAGDPAALAEVIHLALRAKVRVVESDPRESGPRRLLNLGHTLGHALEAHARGALPHGMAVGRGLHFALDVAERRGALAATAAARCRALLVAYGFAASPLPPLAQLRDFVARDKKVDHGVLHFVLPTAIGSSRTEPIPLAEVLALL